MTKSSKMMAFVDIEDLYGVMETVVFPNVYERCQDILNEDEVVAMKGKLNFKEGEIPKVLADNVMLLDDPEVETIAKYRSGGRSSGANGGGGSGYGGYAVSDEDEAYAGPIDGYSSDGERSAEPVKVRIPQDMEESDVLQKIKEVLKKYPGNT